MASESSIDIRKQLAIAVLGPALIVVTIYLLFRVFDMGPPVFRLVPEGGEIFELPEAKPVSLSLDEVLDRVDEPHLPQDLTESDPRPEQLRGVLETCDPKVAAESFAAIHVYVIIGDLAYFHDAATRELRGLDSKQEGFRALLDPTEKGFHAPVALIFCSPRRVFSSSGAPTAGDFQVGPKEWVAAAEARFRALTAARARGLIAVPRFECSRRALAIGLGLYEEQQVLTVLLLSGSGETP